MLDIPLIVASTLKVVGDVLIVIAVLGAHQHIIKERQIDRDVLIALKRERLYALVGIVLIVTGYVVEIASRTFFV